MRDFVQLQGFQDRLQGVVQFLAATTSNYESLVQTFNGVLANHELLRLKAMQDQADNLKMSIEDSPVFTAYCKLKELHSLRLQANGEQSTVDMMRDLANARAKIQIDKAKSD
mmetsp:Transcript_13078/g.15105  ORF Transcript_13078/g.15105 Transcript_13078/m.15105 type:complete len:112 (+) Transcript_13078:188-523(+)